MRPRMRPGLSADLTVLAEAVIGAAAAQPVHRETTNPHDLTSTPPVVSPAPEVTAAERAVILTAREFYRTGGQSHHELMDAVQDLERAIAAAATSAALCYCGTGQEHVRGRGWYCGRPKTDD